MDSGDIAGVVKEVELCTKESVLNKIIMDEGDVVLSQQRMTVVSQHHKRNIILMARERLYNEKMKSRENGKKR